MMRFWFEKERFPFRLPRTSEVCIVILILFSTAVSSVWAQGAPPSKGNESSEDQEINEDEIAKDSTTEINVKNADIAAIVRIFGRKTKRNYILDERVKGKVSIYLPGKVSTEESIRILDSVLAYKGFAAVPIGENLWKIVPAKEAKQSTIPTVMESPDGEPSRSMVTRLVQLQYVSADEVRQLVSQLISPDGFLNAYAGTNSLVIIDTEDNIERIIDIIRTLDIPFTDREMTIIPIKYADAVDIATKLNDLLNENEDSKAGTDSTPDLLRARAIEVALAGRAAGTAGGSPNTAGGAGANALSTSSTVQARAKQPKISADERTNSVIVVADEDTTARIRALIAQLDTKLDLSGTRFYVYRCQNAKAEELAEVLAGLVGEGGISSGKDGTSGGLTPSGGDLISGGMNSNANRPRGSQFDRTQSRLQSQQRTPGRARSEGGSGGSPKTTAIGENISITADPSTNSLIIVAGKTDYMKIRELLEQLDIKRRQVLVEATLLEVGIDESKEMAMSFITSGGGADGGFLAQNNGANIGNLIANPAAVQDFSIAAASAGTITIGGGDSPISIPSQSVLLQAARSNSNVNILSAPTILTTDNEEAEIVVGQNVPFLASTATSGDNLSNTFNQIDRQDVGITLRLTPQISSTNSVTLKIFTEVSSVVSTDPRLGPTTSLRTSETNVITKDGQMVVIGGLMSDEINEGESGVPYLKDIPVLGHLFRSTSDRRRRANLLILITPRVIRDQFDARDATIENADRVGTEIKTMGMYPSREEVLNDMRIDRVTEPKVFDGEKPTTIRGPDRSGDQFDAAEKHGSLMPQKGSDDVLEFRVDPKFPDSAKPQASVTDGTEARANIRAEIIGSHVADTPQEKSIGSMNGGSVYVVLQGTIPDSVRSALPFALGKDDSIGIVVPSDASKQVKSFFAAGKSLAYRLDQQVVPLQVLSVFPNQTEAQSLHPSVPQDWYTLSPYEIMNLGSGPWMTNPG